MAFGHPSQHDHMMSGVEAAMKSVRTPAHLKQHLMARLQGGKEMGKLTTKARKALPKSDFAIPSKEPGSGSYPIPDASHARNALSRVSRFGSPTEKAAVRKKVKAKFPMIGKKKKEPKMPNPFYGE